MAIKLLVVLRGSGDSCVITASNQRKMHIVPEEFSKEIMST